MPDPPSLNLITKAPLLVWLSGYALGFALGFLIMLCLILLGIL